MSICSTSSSNEVSGFAAAWKKGYRFTTTRSTGVIPCAAIAARSSGRLRRANIPANIAGWSVLTRPSIISGNPVTSETLTTGSPAAAIAFAVPPVEMSSMPKAVSPRASSTRPFLSETLNIARISV
jgi:hypothetical protein